MTYIFIPKIITEKDKITIQRIINMAYQWSQQSRAPLSMTTSIHIPHLSFSNRISSCKDDVQYTNVRMLKDQHVYFWNGISLWKNDEWYTDISCQHKNKVTKVIARLGYQYCIITTNFLDEIIYIAMHMTRCNRILLAKYWILQLNCLWFLSNNALHK